jgi:hypothetical protein
MACVNMDGFSKSPSAALRFTFVVAHSLGFARLAFGAFYLAIPFEDFFEAVGNQPFLEGKNKGYAQEWIKMSCYKTPLSNPF